jgi:hypothetical protein
MTRYILEFVRDIRSPGLQLAGAAVVAVPLTFAWVYDALARAARQARVESLLAERELRCPQGHRVALRGAWTCGGCGRTSIGHAFDPCVCGAITDRVRCACGVSLDNPIVGDQIR